MGILAVVCGFLADGERKKIQGRTINPKRIKIIKIRVRCLQAR